MVISLLLTLAASADVTPEQLQLLQTFSDEFVEITPGKGEFPRSFVMGRGRGARPQQQPAHEVSLNYDFRISKYEVPQNLWQAVMGSNPSRWKGPRNSVEMLSFDEAQTFCRKLTQLMRGAKLIRENQEVRLPTEAEWEYIVRAATTTVYSFGDEPEDLDDYAWHTGNASGNDPPVGAKKPNPWGLYDVHGYLWEWCLDHWHPNYTSAPTDGSAWLEAGNDQRRVLRGGSWKDEAQQLTSGSRRVASASLRDDAVGLRCVLAGIRTEKPK